MWVRYAVYILVETRDTRVDVSFTRNENDIRLWMRRGISLGLANSLMNVSLLTRFSPYSNFSVKLKLIREISSFHYHRERITESALSLCFKIGNETFESVARKFSRENARAASSWYFSFFFFFFFLPPIFFLFSPADPTAIRLEEEPCRSEF